MKSESESGVPGHDTTSASLAWTLHLVGLNPRVQAILHEEIDHVLGDSKEVTNEMLNEFKYLDMVLKESLRLYPSVPSVMRELTEEAVIGNVSLPAGTSISVEIQLLLNNPRYWDNPSEFLPERWENESEDPYLYIPFSAG